MRDKTPRSRRSLPLAEIRRPVRMVFGEYRSTLVCRLIRLLDLLGKRVIFVDDGAATLRSTECDPADYDESRRQTVERVYERIPTHPSGTAQVVESAGRTPSQFGR